MLPTPKELWSPRTLSFWLAVLSIVLLFSDKKSAKLISTTSCLLVGFGGMGCAYGRHAEQAQVPIEPIAIARSLVWKDAEWDERLKEAYTHGVFALIGCVKLWKILEEK